MGYYSWVPQVTAIGIRAKYWGPIGIYSPLAREKIGCFYIMDIAMNWTLLYIKYCCVLGILIYLELLFNDIANIRPGLFYKVSLHIVNVNRSKLGVICYKIVTL